MTTAASFFASRDSTSTTFASEQGLWDWVNDPSRVSELVSSPATWSLEAGRNVFFRGQADSTQNLSSSLYRRCEDRCDEAGAGRVSEQVLAAAERAVIDVMREQGLGRCMTDGELLAVLQHHGIPTRLIDVSEAALEALFFAVDRDHGSSGRLFVIHPHPRGTRVDTLNLGSRQDLAWVGSARGQGQSRGEWTFRVAVVADPSLDPRMRAQRGRFLVGGLSRCYGGQFMRGVRSDDFPRVSNLNINWLQSRTSSPNKAWPASGWTIEIPAEWKPGLLARLKDVEPHGITPDSMYPPLQEVGRLALRVAREAVDAKLSAGVAVGDD